MRISNVAEFHPATFHSRLASGRDLVGGEGLGRAGGGQEVGVLALLELEGGEMGGGWRSFRTRPLDAAGHAIQGALV